MIIPLTIILGTVGYFHYKSKDKISLDNLEKIKSSGEQKKEDDPYKNLEDLFI